jgi:hypothetical protein
MPVNSRGSLPPELMAAYAAAHRQPARKATAKPAPALVRPAPPQTAASGLAAGLRGLLDAIDSEVRAVSRLSEQIDSAVSELNGLREEQASRLLMLDALQGEASDPSLQAFLTKTIRPSKARVVEVVPERLQ